MAPASPDSPILVFGPFRMDIRDERLWRDHEVVPLTNKAFSVLRCLLQHPDQLVTKDALIESVWTRSHVSDAALAMSIREIRSALRDDVRSPRYIETVRGRGYRFIGPLSTDTPTHKASVRLTLPHRTDPIAAVGRARELGMLSEVLEAVLSGRRRTVFIGGEAGIGKSTVVEAFLSQSASAKHLLVGRGQCIDQQGAGEPYLPILQALTRICATDANALALLKRHAPSWVMQLPALLADEELERMHRLFGDTSHERMLRELAEAVEVLAGQKPLALILEDLHWGDESTMEWLDYVTRLQEPARMLIVCTIRSVDAIVREHISHQVVQGLRGQAQYFEMLLDYLTEADVRSYLCQRTGAAADTEALAQAIHRRTNGNPLFMVALIDTLLADGYVRATDNGWKIEVETDVLMARVPESLSHLMEQQLNRVDPELRQLLDAASVIGPRFAAAAAAAGTQGDEEAVDRRLSDAANRGQLVSEVGEVAWPDGTVSGQYGFIHSLYQEMMYARLAARYRLRLHRLIGVRMEAAFGDRSRDIAVDLARHFEGGHEYLKAAEYRMYAGENALQRNAHQDAIAHHTHALDLLEKLPATDHTRQLELSLQSNLGSALIAAHGYAWPETAKAFSRARQLCTRLERSEKVVEVMYGVCLFHLDRAQMDVASKIATEALGTAARTGNPLDALIAHRLMGTCHFFQGRLDASRQHLQQALELYSSGHHDHLMYSQAVHPKVAILCWLHRVTFLMGHCRDANALIGQAVDLARESNHLHSLAYALREACFIPQYQAETGRVLQHSEELIGLARERGYGFELHEGQLHRSWCTAIGKPNSDNITALRRDLDAYRSTGSEFQVPYFLTLVAGALKQAEELDEALDLLEQALKRIAESEERWFEAEIYRLRGEIRLRQDRRQASLAEADYFRALDIARSQGAGSLELRAAISAAGLWLDTDRSSQGRDLLASTLKGLPEDSDTPDAREARTLLASSD